MVYSLKDPNPLIFVNCVARYISNYRFAAQFAVNTHSTIIRTLALFTSTVRSRPSPFYRFKLERERERRIVHYYCLQTLVPDSNCNALRSKSGSGEGER